MVSGKAIATIILFILSIASVIRPVKLPLPFTRKKFPFNLLTTPIIVIGILWASQCLGASTIRNGIVGTAGVKPYNILILFFSLAYMSITLDVTGILKAAAYWVSNVSGKSGSKLFIYFYLMVTLLSGFLGNDPVILSGTLFLVYYTNATELDELPWLMSEFAAANTASMILFVGNPTNVVICEGFGIQNAAFTGWTFFPFAACSITCLATLYAQYRVSGKLKLELPDVDKFSVRAAIVDLPGAIVGSILLAGCLITALVVSFLNIDVWKITLPFACAKFIFDIFWDLYRVMNKSIKPSPQSSITTVGEEGGAYPPISLPISKSPTKLTMKSENQTQPWWASNYYTQHAVGCTKHYLPTLYQTFPRLPFALVPFAFSQFILIEALDRQGWIQIFSRWLVIATGTKMYPTLWIVGIIGVILCNIAGTNIGATILLTKVVRAANLPFDSTRAAGVALAVSSNIGAVSFVFSASLAGLLWKGIIDDQKPGNKITQVAFAKWNIIPLLVMMGVGLAVVSVEVYIKYR